jgi:hypothetical protein
VPCQNLLIAADQRSFADYAALWYSLISPLTTLLRSILAVILMTRPGWRRGGPYCSLDAPVRPVETDQRRITSSLARRSACAASTDTTDLRRHDARCTYFRQWLGPRTGPRFTGAIPSCRSHNVTMDTRGHAEHSQAGQAKDQRSALLSWVAITIKTAPLCKAHSTRLCPFEARSARSRLLGRTTIGPAAEWSHACNSAAGTNRETLQKTVKEMHSAVQNVWSGHHGDAQGNLAAYLQPDHDRSQHLAGPDHRGRPGPLVLTPAYGRLLTFSRAL